MPDSIDCALLRGFAVNPSSLPSSRRLAGAIVTAAALTIASTGCRMISTGRNVDGVRYFQQGNYPVAMDRFQAAMTADSRNPDTYYNMAAVRHQGGLVNRDQNSLTQAESLYQQALAYDPNHVDAYRGLAVLLTQTNRTPDAFALLNRWAVSNPGSAEARVELARLYEEYNQPKEAETALNTALQIDVHNWRALAALGRLRESQGDYAQALQNYQTAYANNRFSTDLPVKIASLQSKVSPIQSGAPPLASPAATNRSAASAVPFRRY
jgi:tetratricopeptide (TPR) repeat protein